MDLDAAIVSDLAAEELASFIGEGSGAAAPRRTLPDILCCLCGTKIPPNPANMCVTCLRTQVDITAGIPKQLMMYQCRTCHRYQRPPWVAAELESRELLAVCLKKIGSLQRAKLVDAGFIWTEPHSRRVKVKLTIQKDTDLNVRLQQAFVVEFVVQNQQCEDCARSYTDHTWKTCLQVRQRVDHKKTFFYLEQLILKHNAHLKCSKIETTPDGVDFMFTDKPESIRFLNFLSSVVPLRWKAAKQLVSQDVKSNTFNYKYTYAVDIAPICKDDLLVLPPKSAALLGSISPLTLVYRVSNYIYLVDPQSLQTAELTAERYFQYPFRAVRTSSQLVEFIVLDVTPVAVEVKEGTGAADTAFTAPIGAADKRGSSASSVRGGGGGDSASVMSSSTAGRRRGAGTGSRRGRGHSEDLDDNSEDRFLSVGGRARAAARASGASGALLYGAGGAMGSGRDDVSLITSLPGTARSVGAGQGGMGGVMLGRRVYTSASSVTTSVVGGPKGKYLLAEIEVARARDFGENDTRFVVRSHLGNILRPGDTVMGYDLSGAVFNDLDLKFEDGVDDRFHTRKSKGRSGAKGRVLKGPLPEVVLVRKVYPKVAKRSRKWQLKRLAVEQREEEVESGVSASAGDEGEGAETEGVGGSSATASGGAKVDLASLEDADEAVLMARIAEKRRKAAARKAAAAAAAADGEEGEGAAGGGGGGGGGGRRRRMAAEERAAKDEADFEEFLEELEHDPVMRRKIKLYRKKLGVAEAGAEAKEGEGEDTGGRRKGGKASSASAEEDEVGDDELLDEEEEEEAEGVEGSEDVEEGEEEEDEEDDDELDGDEEEVEDEDGEEGDDVEDEDENEEDEEGDGEGAVAVEPRVVKESGWATKTKGVAGLDDVSENEDEDDDEDDDEDGDGGKGKGRGASKGKKTAKAGVAAAATKKKVTVGVTKPVGAGTSKGTRKP